MMTNEMELFSQEEGVMGSGGRDVAANRPASGGRRIKILGIVVLACVLVVVIVVPVVLARRNDQGSASLSTGASSNQAPPLATTPSPTQTQTVVPTPSPTSVPIQSPTTSTGDSGNQAPSVATTPSPTQTQTVAHTPSPTPAPTQSPTTSPAALPAGSAQYICEGDRYQNSVPLETNHFLCDSGNRYRFGMDDTGALIYTDDVAGKTALIYQGAVGDYFELQQDARFTVNNSTNVKWELQSSEDVSFSAACLPTNQRVYDCPYLHLHSDGVIVLNFIANGWQVRDVLHIYDLPECNNQFFC